METSNLLTGSSGKIVGVIIPPPDIRLVVDKTALFVSRNGKSFEQRILASGEGKTAKFNFMKPLDPYHAYYEMKIREFEEKEAAGGSGGTEEQKSQPPSTEAEQVAPAPAPTAVEQVAPKPAAAKSSVKAKASIVNPIAVAILQLGKPEELAAPTPLEFSLGHPTGINAVDIDIIKLTAQYTAVNGREFLGGLAQREQKNPQFDFLKPTHVLFSYFTALVDSYAKILQPSTEQSERLKQLSQPKKALSQALQRWQYNRAQEDRKRKESAEADEERLAFQSIDWQDFTVVETVDFPENELFEVDIASINVNKDPADGADVSKYADAKRAEISRSKSTFMPPPVPLPPVFKAPPAAPTMPPAFSMPPPPPGVILAQRPEPVSSDAMDVDEDFDQDIKVVTNYQPRIGGSAAGGAGNKPLVMVDPISGKTIPVDQMEEHMRVQLLDPKWREEQKRFAEKQKETGYAEGSSIADSLRMFAKKRGDIFGQSAAGNAPDSAAAIAEEAALEKRRQEEASAVQWDGHQSSISHVVKMKTDLQASSSSVGAPTPSAPQTIVGPFGPSAVPTFSASTPAVVASIPTPLPMHIPAPAAMIPVPLPIPLPVLPPPIAAFAPPPPAFVAAVPLPAAPAPIAPYLPMGIAPVPVPLPMGFPVHAPPAAAPVAEPEKKQRELVSAEEFAAKYPGPIHLLIVVGASADLQTWNLMAGQIIHVNVSVNTSVKELKELLAIGYVNGMPAGKQQLKVAEIGFLKDTSTLAAMNIDDGATIELSAKSRGGKK